MEPSISKKAMWTGLFKCGLENKSVSLKLLHVDGCYSHSPFLQPYVEVSTSTGEWGKGKKGGSGEARQVKGSKGNFGAACVIVGFQGHHKTRECKADSIQTFAGR